MNRVVMLVGMVLVCVLAPLYVLAQTQSEEKMLVGRVQSVDDSGTELTLADGTKLLTPPGAQFNPGALEQGMDHVLQAEHGCDFDFLRKV